MDRGTWQAVVHGAAKSQTQLSGFHFHMSQNIYLSLSLKAGLPEYWILGSIFFPQNFENISPLSSSHWGHH